MKLGIRLLAIVLGLVALHVNPAEPRPEVEIAQGGLVGVTENGISSFKGIPFAAPPVGELRWFPPQPHEGWEGVRDAGDFGNVCPQNLQPGYSLEVLGDRPMSEDCLQLNVWTAIPDPDAKRPVMVWILPGGFSVGDTSMPRYDGTALAEQGVVVVTFNYRLGMLGVGGSLNPVVDGKIVTRGVGATFSEGAQHKIPYMTGATSWEGSLLWWAKSSNLLLQVLHVSPADALTLYGDADYKVVNNKLYVDFFFGSQRHFARHHAGSGQPTIVYFFSRILDDHQDDLPGAAHGAEMRYAFKTLDTLTLLEGGIGDFGNRPNTTDETYSEMVSAYWVQFPKTGNPNGTGLPGWPGASPGNDLLLEFAQTGVTVHRDFREERREFWEAHFDAGKL